HNGRRPLPPEPSVPLESSPSRRELLLGAAAAALATATRAPAAPDVKPFEFGEATLADLEARLKSGSLTSRALTEKYLARIDEIDRKGPAINSVIEVNPDALAIAADLDKERKEKGPRGPLHGIPVLIKDNIDTADKMQTTAGSLALFGSRPPKDSA